VEFYQQPPLAVDHEQINYIPQDPIAIEKVNIIP